MTLAYPANPGMRSHCNSLAAPQSRRKENKMALFTVGHEYFEQICEQIEQYFVVISKKLYFI